MYKIGHRVLKLDAVITEFCDIYAPIAQLLREEDEEREIFRLQYLETVSAPQNLRTN